MIEAPVDREPPSSIYGEAKKIGIRIVIRRLEVQKMMVKRTQLLTPDTVREMCVAGMTVKAIADEFLVDSKRIVRILRFDSK